MLLSVRLRDEPNDTVREALVEALGGLLDVALRVAERVLERVGLADGANGGAEVRRVTPGSDAAEELRPGDVILEVNKARVASADEAVKAVKGTPAGEPVLLKVRSRDGSRTRYVALERK